MIFTDKPILAFLAGDLLPLGGFAGQYAVLWPRGSDTVLSVQPDGTYETRPKDFIGPWETAMKVGDKLVYTIDDNVYVIAIVEGV